MWESMGVKKKNGKKIYVRYFIHSDNSPNIMYIQTPIGSVDSVLKKAYEPLVAYGFNVFAIDLFGVGKSDGNMKDLSKEGIIEDLDACRDYIDKKYDGPLHFFGGTGIGGIIGQFYVSAKPVFKSFVQYGSGIYMDTQPLGYKPGVLKIALFILRQIAKIKPKLEIEFPVPKYNGYNKELDDSFYEMLLKIDPNVFKLNIAFLITLLSILLDKDSKIKELPQMPTLVFATKHDRYFDYAYFKKYYDMLLCEKKIYSIDDVHNSHYFRADEIAGVTAKWFKEHC